MLSIDNHQLFIYFPLKPNTNNFNFIKLAIFFKCEKLSKQTEYNILAKKTIKMFL